MASSLLTLLLVALSILSIVDAGTWLSFNDMKEEGAGAIDLPIRPRTTSLGEIMSACTEMEQKRSKRSIHRIETRQEKENNAMCKFLMRGRSAY